MIVEKKLVKPTREPPTYAVYSIRELRSLSRNEETSSA
jgi:hypothetical protein